MSKKSYFFSSIAALCTLLTGCGNGSSNNKAPSEPKSISVNLTEDFRSSNMFTAEEYTDGLVISGSIPQGEFDQNKHSIRINTGTQVEDFVSGNKIRVAIKTSSNDASLFKAAYVTNEVGNSGFVELKKGSATDTLEFEYKVSPKINGKNDTIYILPEILSPGQMQILQIDIELVE